MPEPIDFEQLARRMFPVEHTGQDAVGAELSADSRDHLIALLRQVWNARGAADIAKVEVAIEAALHGEAPVDSLTTELRKLDR
ncbi:MAG: hypothetical protein ABI665_15115 [Vicinamibacterales bacterium]